MSRTAVAVLVVVSCLLPALAGCQSPPANVRSATLADVAGLPADDDEMLPPVYDKLAANVREFRLPQITLENALHHWAAEIAGVNAVVNWSAMEAIGITKDTQVTLQLRDVSAETALREILVRATGREGVLDFTIREDVIGVSTVEDLNQQKRIAIYNVRDLRAASEAWGKLRDKRYAGRLPEIVYDPPIQPRWDWGPGDVGWTEAMLNLVRSLVHPDTWAPTGDANIIATDGLLVVKQTCHGHQGLARFLMAIRYALAISDQPAMPKLPRPVLNHYERMALARQAPATQPGGDPHLPLEPAVNERVRESLRKRLPEFRFKVVVGFEGEVRPVGFESALLFIRDLQRLNINPNWAAMEAIGITRETPINLMLKDVSLETALRELLTKAAGREGVLDFDVRDGVIKVSTVEDLSHLKYVLIYDVRDLVSAMDRAHDRRWDSLREQMPKKVTVRRRPATAMDGDDDAAAYEWDGVYEASDLETEMVGHLMDTLRSLVLPNTWAPSGDANIHYYTGLLIVKQSANGHRRLGELLTRLRRSYAAAEAAEQPVK